MVFQNNNNNNAGRLYASPPLQANQFRPHINCSKNCQSLDAANDPNGKYGDIDQQKLSNLKTKIKDHNGVFAGLTDLPLSEIANPANSRHQVRQTMSDAGHTARLTAEIQNMGLLEPVPVKWNSAKQKFVLIGGHHRYDAAVALGWSSIPVIVISDFPTTIDEEKFKLQHNRHPAQKGMNAASAAMNADNWVNKGLFDSLKNFGIDSDAFRIELYQWLTDNFPSVKAAKKKTILDDLRAKRGVKSQMKNYSTPQAKAEASKIGYSKKDPRVHVSDFNNFDRTFGSKMMNQAEAYAKDNSIDTLKLQVVLHKTKAKDAVELKRTRKAQLKSLAEWNMAYASPNPNPPLRVEKITFLAQIKDRKGTLEQNGGFINYKWDSEAAKFVSA